MIASHGLLPSAVQAVSASPQQTNGIGDLVLVNGKFVDGRGVVGSSLTIRNGRIVNVGQATTIAPGAQTIDVGGRTVIPGFFDAHVHFTRAADQSWL